MTKFLALLFIVYYSFPFYAAAQDNAGEQIKKYVETAGKAGDDEAYMAAMTSADSLARRVNNVAAQAQVNRDIGGHFYDVDPDECIKYLTKAHRLYNTAGNKNEATYCLQNIAFAYQDKKKDYEESMKFTRRAITARTEMKDTANMANMYKYQAMLYGKLHDFKAGKASAAKAVQLYTAIHQLVGVAVSYRDLAIVYEEAKEYDSAIHWMQQSKNIWLDESRKTKFASRIYGNNADMMRMYTKAGTTEEALPLVAENEAMDATTFHYADRLSFYKEARDMYTKSRDKENAKLYKDKYTELRNQLRAEGKVVD